LLVALLLLPATLLAQTQTAVFTVTWTSNNTGHSGFNVERSATQTGTFTKVGSTNATTTTYVDNIASDPGGAQKCYRVAAFNTAGQGPYSTVACATSPTVIVPPVNPPTGINVVVSVTVTQSSGTPAPSTAAAPQKAKK